MKSLPGRFEGVSLDLPPTWREDHLVRITSPHGEGAPVLEVTRTSSFDSLQTIAAKRIVERAAEPGFVMHETGPLRIGELSGIAQRVSWMSKRIQFVERQAFFRHGGSVFSVVGHAHEANSRMLDRVFEALVASIRTAPD